MRIKENKAKIAITIDPELLRRLNDLCDITQRTRSRLIEQIIRDGIEQHEQIVKDMEKPLVRAMAKIMVGTPGVMEAMIKIVGDHMTKEELHEIRKGASKQFVLGEKRQVTKKKKKFTKKA